MRLRFHGVLQAVRMLPPYRHPEAKQDYIIRKWLFITSNNKKRGIAVTGSPWTGYMLSFRQKLNADPVGFDAGEIVQVEGEILSMNSPPRQVTFWTVHLSVITYVRIAMLPLQLDIDEHVATTGKAGLGYDHE